MSLYVVILAAGKGSRLSSHLSKPFCIVAGVPMIYYSIKSALTLTAKKIILVINKENIELLNQVVFEYFPEENNITVVIQEELNGTAAAVKSLFAHPDLFDETQQDLHQSNLLVLYSDLPAIEPQTLVNFVGKFSPYKMAITSFYNDNNLSKNGLIQFEGDKVSSILEDSDSLNNNDSNVDSNRNKALYNLGPMLINLQYLKQFINNIKLSSIGEYYLTDIVNIFYANDFIVGNYIIAHSDQVLNVNTPEQLIEASSALQKRKASELISAGVVILDIQNTYISVDAVIECGTVIHPYSFIGNNTKVGKNCTIMSFSHIEESVINDNSKIGPFARLRNKVKIGNNCYIGNFVEIKNSAIDQKTKIAHLSYIGDSTIGENVNIGAGVITCNYDGNKKWNTIIGNNAFIGTSSLFIAPVYCGDNIITAAGSIITKDIPDNTFTSSRSNIIQKNFEGKVNLIKQTISKKSASNKENKLNS